MDRVSPTSQSHPKGGGVGGVPQGVYDDLETDLD